MDGRLLVGSCSHVVDILDEPALVHGLIEGFGAHMLGYSKCFPTALPRTLRATQPASQSRERSWLGVVGLCDGRAHLRTAGLDQPLRLAEGEHSTVTASTLSIDRTGAISRVKNALTVHVRAHIVVGRTRADLAMGTRAGK